MLCLASVYKGDDVGCFKSIALLVCGQFGLSPIGNDHEKLFTITKILKTATPMLFHHHLLQLTHNFSNCLRRKTSVIQSGILTVSTHNTSIPDLSE